MSKELKLWLQGLGFLFILILFLIPFSIIATDLKKYKDDTDNKIEHLNLKIDSLKNELKTKKDTLIINPIKIEFYERKQS
jgi:hypothetical protein